MVELGLAHLQHGNHSKAFALFGSALTYDPSDPKVCWQRLHPQQADGTGLAYTSAAGPCF